MPQMPQGAPHSEAADAASTRGNDGDSSRIAGNGTPRFEPGKADATTAEPTGAESYFYGRLSRWTPGQPCLAIASTAADSSARWRPSSAPGSRSSIGRSATDGRGPAAAARRPYFFGGGAETHIGVS